MQLENKLGYEFLIERKIEPSEIMKVVALPQTVGWRYSPESHVKEWLCVCPVCIGRGDIKGRIKRERVEPPLKIPPYAELLERLKVEKDEVEIATLFSHIGRRRRKTDPYQLLAILDNSDNYSLSYLAIALPAFKHVNTFELLTKLCAHPDNEVREYSAESLLKVNKEKGLAFLQSLTNDEVISKVLTTS
ncbi:HEAT repeat domain-containing protein [Hymenobacter cavernae]|uniref:HEAT repeat domain-containing protein n=1 Tax=Hymenobacter cavernae TaxID=2044852 RepID=A0ABQ1UUJ7_9BACT|nr:HEAT repeat domain-containing protein [Hymenobacter cavernae]GGF26263.1 hypothetical protein GCM10011383_42240 [Hymenobacter cavernae]